MQSKRRRLKEPYVVKIRSILCIFSPFGRIVYERKTTSSSVHVSNIKKFFSWQIIPFLDFLQDVSCLCKREVGTPAFFLKFQAFIQKFSGRIFPSSDHFFLPLQPIKCAIQIIMAGSGSIINSMRLTCLGKSDGQPLALSLEGALSCIPYFIGNQANYLFENLDMCENCVNTHTHTF